MLKKGCRFKKTIGIYTKEQREYDLGVLKKYREYQGEKTKLWTFRRRIKKGMTFEDAILPKP